MIELNLQESEVFKKFSIEIPFLVNHLYYYVSINVKDTTHQVYLNSGSSFGIHKHRISFGYGMKILYLVHGFVLSDVLE